MSLGEIYKEPGSAASLKLASHWLQTCINEHALCRELIGKNDRLPTRVVYVGNEGDEPRLVIPANRTGYSTEEQTRKYLALSYCWGKDVTFKLTKANFKSFQECMPLRHWPKTLHHAVVVAQGLEIPYLWVDALCIIQDDGEDWKLEAARMHDIYNHATVTLFATTSASISDGFLQAENRRVSPECSLPWEIPSLEQSEKASYNKVYLRIHDGDAHEEDDHFRTEGRWRRRGWTLQERLSAARGLSYTHLQMSWHCHSSTIRENNGYMDHTEQTAFDLVEESRLDLHYDTLDRLTALWNGPVKIKNHQRWGVSTQEYHTFLIRYWYRLTNEFQWRSFTYEADKLASVAGLANVLEQKAAGRDRYWAGLWESDWTLGLLWIAWGNKRSREEIDHDLGYCQPQPDGGITKPRAPSWSWASVLAHDFSHWGAEPTDFSSHRCDMHSFLRKVEAPRFATEQERFIPTETLVLRITAPIQRLSDNWREVPKSPQPDVFRSAFERDLRSLFYMTTDEGIEHRSGHFRAEFAQKHQVYHGQHFVAIQVANWIQSYQASVDLPQPAITSQNSNDAWVVFFLILESVPEHTNRYRRVGALALSEVYPFGKQELLEDEIPALQMMREEGPWPEREIELV